MTTAQMAVPNRGSVSERCPQCSRPGTAGPAVPFTLPSNEHSFQRSRVVVVVYVARRIAVSLWFSGDGRSCRTITVAVASRGRRDHPDGQGPPIRQHRGSPVGLCRERQRSRRRSLPERDVGLVGGRRQLGVERSTGDGGQARLVAGVPGGQRERGNRTPLLFGAEDNVPTGIVGGRARRGGLHDGLSGAGRIGVDGEAAVVGVAASAGGGFTSEAPLGQRVDPAQRGLDRFVGDVLEWVIDSELPRRPGQRPGSVVAAPSCLVVPWMTLRPASVRRRRDCREQWLRRLRASTGRVENALISGAFVGQIQPTPSRDGHHDECHQTTEAPPGVA